MTKLPEGLTFDDVLLVPNYSDFLPSNTNIGVDLGKNISINIPILSSPMDTVTGQRMAISIAQNGGLGIIHKNMSIEQQADKVRYAKRYEAYIVTDPITVTDDVTIQDVISLMNEQKVSGIPVLSKKDSTLVGIVTNRDIRFVQDANASITNVMTPREKLVTANPDISMSQAQELLNQNRIEKLLLVNDTNYCIGMITVKDIEKSDLYPNASRDSNGRLLVGAAIGTGPNNYTRAESLVEAGVDVLVVDTAHGHSKNVVDMVKYISSKYPKILLIAGNIVTTDAAKLLIEAGADVVKVGVGPGSICTTRIIAGVGVPQITAIQNVAEYANTKNIPVIADGGIKYSGDISKAIASGAHCVMLGSLLAGTDESPGELITYQNKCYKAYRGMGSIAAMNQGSSDRYLQENIRQIKKYIPEGVEAMVPYKGKLNDVIIQLIGGLRASMGYTGNINIENLRRNTNMIRISSASLKESHVHDVVVTKEPPNYQS